MWLFSWKKPVDFNPKPLENKIDKIETDVNNIKKSIKSNKTVWDRNATAPYTNRQFAFNAIKTITVNANVGLNVVRIKLEPDPAIATKFKKPSLVYLINVFNLDLNLDDNNALIDLRYSGKIEEYTFKFNKSGNFKITVGVFWNSEV